MDLAAERVGYVSSFGIEIDNRFAAMFEANRQEYPLAVIKRPIQSALALDSRRKETGQGALIPKVELLLMGIPCDPWSHMRGGSPVAADHDLYDMTHYALGLVAATNPLNVVIEEVPGYVEDPLYGLLKSVLERAGYHVTHKVVDSNKLGYAAGRPRAYIVATTSKGFSWQKALKKAPKGMRKLKEILLPPDHPAITNSKETQGGWFSTNAPAGIGKFMREHWTRPDWPPAFVDPESTRLPTIVKGYYDWQATGPFVRHPTHKDTYRLLTIEEIRRAHGVPEHYMLPGAVGTQAAALGQAVVVPVIEGIIEALPGGASERTITVRGHRASNPPPIVPVYYGHGPLFSSIPWERLQ